MAHHQIPIDRARSILSDSTSSHNRWHPDIAPALYVNQGDTVEIETRDSFDGQITPSTTAEIFTRLSLDRAHPLTGPVFVNGAEPGDLLAVDIEQVNAAATGFTAILPGFGFLRDFFPQPYLVHWKMADGFAMSEQLPGVRIPGAPFMGVMGLAPSLNLLNQIRAREEDLQWRGGTVFAPHANEAVPAEPRIAETALRTVAPHETGGNIDIKQLVAGTTLFLPVATPGALFSTGDAHFAQGDGESCGTAIETSATLVARFRVLKGEAARRGQRDPSFSREQSVLSAPATGSGRFYATTGISVRRDGRNEFEDITLAARNALVNMVEYLADTYQLSREQAYCLASVAVDLKISQAVDVPNVLVSAFLPLDIFV